MRRLAFCLLIVILCISCDGSRSKIRDIEELTNKTFGVPTNTLAETLILSRFPGAKFVQYGSIWDAVPDLKTGKIEVIAYDEPIMRSIALKNPGFAMLEENITHDEYGFAVRISDKTLKKQIDDVIDSLKESGKYEEMDTHWFPKGGSSITMPIFDLNKGKGVIRFGTAPVTEPFSYKDDKGNIIGFDIELAYYIAESLGKDLEIIEMQFGDMIPNLEAGKVDMVGALLTISEERAKRVLFSKPYYIGGIAAVVKR